MHVREGEHVRVRPLSTVCYYYTPQCWACLFHDAHVPDDERVRETRGMAVLVVNHRM
jgi:hypothetical protein